MQRAFIGMLLPGARPWKRLFSMPFALIYKVAWPTYFADGLLVKVKYLACQRAR